MADADSRAGKVYATSPILDWVAQTHAPHDPGLDAAYRAPEREGMPAIQVGPSEGKTLYLLTRLAGVHRAVEIGTLAGYSAIWIARGLAAGGRLYTIEHEPRHAEVARRAFVEAGVDDRVEVVEGDALERLGQLAQQGPFDLVFADADKGRYDQYLVWAAENLRPGGLLLGDNAFFFGNLLDLEDPSAAAMRRFHEGASAWFDSVCVPTPDGLVVGICNQVPV